MMTATTDVDMQVSNNEVGINCARSTLLEEYVGRVWF